MNTVCRLTFGIDDIHCGDNDECNKQLDGPKTKLNPAEYLNVSMRHRQYNFENRRIRYEGQRSTNPNVCQIGQYREHYEDSS